MAQYAVKSDASEEPANTSEFGITSDYVEEKNHLEPIQKISRNFEKTLGDSRKLYDLGHVDTVTLEDVEDVVSDTGVSRSSEDIEAEVKADVSETQDEEIKPKSKKILADKYR